MIVQGRECVKGVDVSDWQGNVDHAAVKGAGVSFLVAKASEGSSFRAKTYQRNHDGAIAAGLTFGAYHWLKPGIDADTQAAWFLDVTNHGDGCDFLVLDAEEAGITDAQVTAWCRAVTATGKPVVIYCGASTDPQNRSGEWANYTPWLAAYPTNAPDPDPASLRPPKPPAPWGRWDIWQYSSTGSVAGVSGACDVNVADAAWFASLTTTSTPAALPQLPQEDDMVFITSPGANDTWFLYDGWHKRPVGAGENQLLVDLGIVKPDAKGVPFVKMISDDALNAIANA